LVNSVIPNQSTSEARAVKFHRLLESEADTDDVRTLADAQGPIDSSVWSYTRVDAAHHCGGYRLCRTTTPICLQHSAAWRAPPFRTC